ELAILTRRMPELSETLAREVVRFVQRLRSADLTKVPGIAETIDWAAALAALGAERLEAEQIERTLGALLKYQEDVSAMRGGGAGRAVFVRRREERATYDAAFDLFWRRSTVGGGASEALPRIRQQRGPRADIGFGAEPRRGADVTGVVERTARMGASPEERLRTADFADLTPDEARDAAAMLAALSPKLPLRPSRRRQVSR